MNQSVAMFSLWNHLNRTNKSLCVFSLLLINKYMTEARNNPPKGMGVWLGERNRRLAGLSGLYARKEYGQGALVANSMLLPLMDWFTTVLFGG
jgi:hypothetical protein